MDLPFWEACFNGLALVLMSCGLFQVKVKGSVVLHRYCMLLALVSSSVFLTLYLIYHFLYEPKVYQGSWGMVYYPMLISHVILAATIPILVGTTVFWALRGLIDRHRKWAKITFPLWYYVSLTGLLIYAMV